jgi:hypothetical protein
MLMMRKMAPQGAASSWLGYLQLAAAAVTQDGDLLLPGPKEGFALQLCGALRMYHSGLDLLSLSDSMEMEASASSVGSCIAMVCVR